MKDHSKPHPCPSCGEQSPRHMPDSVNGVFQFSTSGIGPQNTGVSDLDTNLDRVVGEDAKKGWAAIEDRNKIKNDVINSNPGASMLDLSKNPDGSYRVMGKKEKEIHARAFTINHMANKEFSNNSTR